MPQRIFCIECKLKLRYLTIILWKSRWEGGSLNLEIMRGGGAQAVLEIQIEGGVKKHTLHQGGGLFLEQPT